MTHATCNYLGICRHMRNIAGEKPIQSDRIIHCVAKEWQLGEFFCKVNGHYCA